MVKTIAITIDEPTLKGIARLAAARSIGGKRPSRSEVIRVALQDYLRRHERREREEKDRASYAQHKARLDEELQALIEEQAEP